MKSYKYGTSENDILTNKKKGYVYMSALEEGEYKKDSGDDKYIINNIKNSFTVIDDSGLYDKNYFLNNMYNLDGSSTDKDTLQINNIQPENLTFLFDVVREDIDMSGSYWSNRYGSPVDDLYIIKNNKIDSVLKQISKYSSYGRSIPQNNAIVIPSFFGDTNDIKPAYPGTEYGHNYSVNNINTIQTSSGGVNRVIDWKTYVNTAREKVIEFLDSIDYQSSAFYLLNDFSKNNKINRNKLLSIYKNTPLVYDIYTDKPNNKISCGNNNTFHYTLDNENISTTVILSKNSNLTIKNETLSNDISYIKRGNNAVIKFNDLSSQIVIKDAFKTKNINITFFPDQTDLSVDLFSSEDIVFDITGQAKNKKGVNLVGSNQKDKISGTKYADKITTNGGVDIVYAGRGNDKIYGYIKDKNYHDNENSKTYVFKKGDGNDTIYNSKNTDVIKFNLTENVEDIQDILKDFTMIKNKNNLTIVYTPQIKSGKKIVQKQDSITISNYFKTSKEDALRNFVFVKSDGTQIGSVYDITNFVIVESGKGKYIGSGEPETIYGSKYSDTIHIGQGHYNIIGSKGDDTIIMDEYVSADIKYYDENMGNDTIIFSDDASTLAITYNTIYDNERYSCEKHGNDLILNKQSTHNYEEDNIIYNQSVSGGSITIKDYYNPDGSKKSNNIINFNNSKIKTTKISVYGDNNKSNIIYGTDSNDSISGGTKSDVMYTRKGDDTISLGMGDSVHINGSGQKVIYFSKKSGSNTIYLEDDSAAIELRYNYKGDILLTHSEDDLVVSSTFVDNGKTKTSKVTIKDYYIKQNAVDIYNLDDGYKYVTSAFTTLPDSYTAVQGKLVGKMESAGARNDCYIYNSIYDLTGKVTIKDKGGNDMLSFLLNNKDSYTDNDDIVFWFNVNKSGSLSGTFGDGMSTTSLYLCNYDYVNHRIIEYNQDWSGYWTQTMEIVDFFGPNINAENAGLGCIEEIKLGTKTYTIDDFNAIRSEVQAYLIQTKSSSAYDILSGQNQTRIQELINIYTGKNN